MLAELPELWARDARRAARRSCRCPTAASAPCCGRRCSAPGPPGGRPPADLRERLHGYAEKAMREAGDRTTWTDPDAAYEEAVHEAVDAVFDDARTHAACSTGLVDRRRRAGLEQRARRQAGGDHRARGVRRLPGQRAVGAEPGRPRQPATGRLRARAGAAGAGPRDAADAADERRGRGRGQAVGHPHRAAAAARRARAVHRLHGARGAGALPPSTCSRSTGVGRSPWSPGCPSGWRRRVAGGTRRRAARRAMARLVERTRFRDARSGARSSTTGGETVRLADLMTDLPVALLVRED